MAAMDTTVPRIQPDHIIHWGAVTYDVTHQRVWIGHQRLHHGAPGALMAVMGLIGLVAHLGRPAVCLEALMTGAVLMVHDGRDLPYWFMRGQQE